MRPMHPATPGHGAITVAPPRSGPVRSNIFAVAPYGSSAIWQTRSGITSLERIIVQTERRVLSGKSVPAGEKLASFVRTPCRYHGDVPKLVELRLSDVARSDVTQPSLPEQRALRRGVADGRSAQRAGPATACGP